MEKTLHLNLKKKWFDMILSGEKKEEYREIKPYWIRRLTICTGPEEMKGENKTVPEDIFFDVQNNQIPGCVFDQILKAYYCKYQTFNSITFTNGYKPDSPRFVIEFKGITVGRPKLEWSDDWQLEVFVLKLGNILKYPEMEVTAGGALYGE